MKNNKGRFLPGNSGRPKGSVNKDLFNIRSKIKEFIQSNWDAVQSDFERLDPKDRLAFIEKLMQYSIPKMASVEYTDQTEVKIDRLTEDQLNEVIEELKNS